MLATDRYSMSYQEILRGNVTLESVKPLILACLPEDELPSEMLLEEMKNLLTFRDVTYFLLRNLFNQLQKINQLELVKPSRFFENVLSLLDLFLATKPLEFLGEPPKPKTHGARHCSLSYLRHFLGQVWMKLLDCWLPDKLMLKALRMLGDDHLNRMSQIKLFADYVLPVFDPQESIMDSDNSVATQVPTSWSRSMARTVLLLVHKGGLNYTRLYPRLYELLDDSLITCSEAGRFLVDMNVYLSSVHLSTKIVASFTKRLAQLALASPANLTPALLWIIANNLKRHPKCRILVNRRNRNRTKADGISNATSKNTDQEMSDLSSQSIGDPFLWDTFNLEGSNALQSSLWEVASLQHHYCKTVATLAHQICNPNPAEFGPDTVTNPDRLITEQNQMLSEATQSVQNGLIVLAKCNAVIPELAPLAGWLDST